MPERTGATTKMHASIPPLSLSLALALTLTALAAHAGPMDTDFDGVPDAVDNCPIDFNPDQTDTDCGGVGDFCDLDFIDLCALDDDADGVPDGQDNCPSDANPDQSDIDVDGVGDAAPSAPNASFPS